MKVLVAFDGSLDAKAALRYGEQKVREFGGELIVFHVFPRHRFIDYDAGPRAEELARRESAGRLDEARHLLRRSGGSVRARLVLAEGNEREEILKHATEEDVDLIAAPPRLESLMDDVCCLMDVVSAAEDAVPEPSGVFDGQEGIAEAARWRLP